MRQAGDWDGRPYTYAFVHSGVCKTRLIAKVFQLTICLRQAYHIVVWIATATTIFVGMWLDLVGCDWLMVPHIKPPRG